MARKAIDKIVIVNTAARAEGLSYGKYMAKYNWEPPCLRPFRDVYDTPEVKLCKVCGQEIPKPRLRMNAKTCCAVCGDELRRRDGVQRQRKIREEKKKDGALTDQSQGTAENDN